MKNKHILFLLLITSSTVFYGMETVSCSNVLAEKALYTPDIISYITQNLCKSHNYQLLHVKNNIWSFSLTNQFFRNYFTQEKVGQNIIKLCAQHLETNDMNAAIHLRCRAIEKKMDYFFNIAQNQKKQFTELDLKDQWYLNTTTFSGYNGSNSSLLYKTINKMNFKAADAIINHAQKLDFHYNNRESELHLITTMRSNVQTKATKNYPDRKKIYNELLVIAERLLQKNMLPDGRENDGQVTPLLQAILYEDEDLVRLLLQYGANPYIRYYCCFKHPNHTIFQHEKENLDWLTKIIEEVKQHKNNQKI